MYEDVDGRTSIREREPTVGGKAKSYGSSWSVEGNVPARTPETPKVPVGTGDQETIRSVIVGYVYRKNDPRNPRKNIDPDQVAARARRARWAVLNPCRSEPRPGRAGEGPSAFDFGPQAGHGTIELHSISVSLNGENRHGPEDPHHRKHDHQLDKRESPLDTSRCGWRWLGSRRALKPSASLRRASARLPVGSRTLRASAANDPPKSTRKQTGSPSVQAAACCVDASSPHATPDCTRCSKAEPM